MRLVLIALLTTAASCAAPPASDDPGRPSGTVVRGAADDRQAGGDPQDQGNSPRAAPSDEASGVAGAEPRVQPGVEPEASAAAGGPPEWWHDQPVRRGSEVSVCAEAVAAELRSARQSAIRAAYAMLEEELGSSATDASIGSEYEATQVGSDWRFRVRITGSRQ